MEVKYQLLEGFGKKLGKVPQCTLNYWRPSAWLHQATNSDTNQYYPTILHRTVYMVAHLLLPVTDFHLFGTLFLFL